MAHDSDMAHFDERRDTMFWIFLIFLVLAFVFAQLGAYSVWFVIFKGGLQIALLVVAGLLIVLLWKKMLGGKNGQ